MVMEPPPPVSGNIVNVEPKGGEEYVQSVPAGQPLVIGYDPKTNTYIS